MSGLSKIKKDKKSLIESIKKLTSYLHNSSNIEKNTGDEHDKEDDITPSINVTQNPYRIFQKPENVSNSIFQTPDNVNTSIFQKPNNVTKLPKKSSSNKIKQSSYEFQENYNITQPPTISPSTLVIAPSDSPTSEATTSPSNSPTSEVTTSPSNSPTSDATTSPSTKPTYITSMLPSITPTYPAYEELSTVATTSANPTLAITSIIDTPEPSFSSHLSVETSGTPSFEPSNIPTMEPMLEQINMPPVESSLTSLPTTISLNVVLLKKENVDVEDNKNTQGISTLRLMCILFLSIVIIFYINKKLRRKNSNWHRGSRSRFDDKTYTFSKRN